MYLVTLSLSDRQKELLVIAEHLRNAYWEAATSEDTTIAQSSNSRSDFNTTKYRSVYDVCGFALHEVLIEMQVSYNDLPVIWDCIADGNTVEDALKHAGDKRMYN